MREKELLREERETRQNETKKQKESSVLDPLFPTSSFLLSCFLVLLLLFAPVAFLFVLIQRVHSYLCNCEREKKERESSAFTSRKRERGEVVRVEVLSFTLFAE